MAQYNKSIYIRRYLEIKNVYTYSCHFIQYLVHNKYSSMWHPTCVYCDLTATCDPPPLCQTSTIIKSTRIAYIYIS